MSFFRAYIGSSRPLRIVRLGILSILVVVPFLIDIDAFYPFVIPRTLFFQITVDILLAYLLVRNLFTADESGRRRSLLAKAIFFFLFAGVLSNLASPDISKTFFGSAERALGVWNLLHYGFFFLVLSRAVRTPAQWMLLLKTSVAVSSFMAFHFIVSTLRKGVTEPSLFGNPLFLESYLLVHLWLIPHLITQARKRRSQWLLAFLFGMHAFAIVLSNVRGGFVGLAVGMAVFLFLSAMRTPRFRLALMGGMVLLAFLYGTVFVFRDHPAIKKNAVIQRITNFSLEDSTIRSRLILWNMAWKGLAERPILGWGRENYSLIFTAYFDPRFEELKLGEKWDDRAHNIFFEEAVSGGIVGLAAFLFLLGAALKAAWKYPAFVALLASYSADHFFGIEMISSYLPLFLAFGYVDFLNRPAANESTAPAPVKGFWEAARSKKREIAFAAPAAAVLIFFIGVNVQMWMANRNLHIAGDAMFNRRYAEFPRAYTSGLALLEPFQYLKSEYLGLLAAFLVEHGTKNMPFENFIHYTEVVTNDLKKFHGRVRAEQRWSYQLALLSTQHGQLTRKKEPLDMAKRVWNDLISFVPQRKLLREGLEKTEELERDFFPALSQKP